MSSLELGCLVEDLKVVVDGGLIYLDPWLDVYARLAVDKAADRAVSHDLS